MYVLEVRSGGKPDYYGPFGTIDRAREYAIAAGWDPCMADVLPLTVPHNVVKQIVWRNNYN